MTDITSGRRLAGASVLPYSCDPSHNNIYFLLGAERKLPKWHDSSKWSDFGGAPKKKKGMLENEAECAGREFHEETLGAVKWHEDENGKGNNVNFVRQNSLPIIKDLEAGNFHFKMVTLIDDDRYYTTYVKQVPFDASVQRRTNNLLSSLGRIRMDVKNSGFHDLNSYEKTSIKEHPSVRLNAEDQCIGVSKDYLEKQSLQWLSIPQIQDCLDGEKGQKNNYVLRDSFKGRVQNILDQFQSVRLDTEKISTDNIEITKYLPKDDGKTNFEQFENIKLGSIGKNQRREFGEDGSIFRHFATEASGFQQ